MMGKRQKRSSLDSDGQRLFPFDDHGIIFVPQAVGRPVTFLFVFYTSCHHLKEFTKSDFLTLEKLVRLDEEVILVSSASASNPGAIESP